MLWADIANYLGANGDDGSAEWAAPAAVLTCGWRSLSPAADLAQLAEAEIELVDDGVVIWNRFHKTTTAGLRTVRIEVHAVKDARFCPVRVVRAWWKTRRGWRPCATRVLREDSSAGLCPQAGNQSGRMMIH